MTSDQLTDIIENFLDGMRLEIHCVAHQRRFEQHKLCRMLAQEILDKELHDDTR